MPITILLADDHRMIRQGLRSLLCKDSQFDVIGEAEDGRTAVKLAGELMPAVVVMDVRMPDLNGIEATRQILAENPGTKVNGLTGHFHPELAHEMLRAGACGYVLKDSAVDELTSAIHAVLKGEVYLSPPVLGVMVNDFIRADGDGRASVFTELSPREREVLQLVAEGKSTKQAATMLNVSVKTIETHRRNLMEKLKLDNVADLTKYAIRQGLASL
ncbi:MAG: response regulator containing a CheY-like receiver domain and an DNA-binding domain [Phycisphaerales bacterium]|nr:response regulator containing a CheY-like receiver domain and an DNA-binding domain [Phycisphaerales bacterium]